MPRPPSPNRACYFRHHHSIRRGGAGGHKPTTDMASTVRVPFEHNVRTSYGTVLRLTWVLHDSTGSPSRFSPGSPCRPAWQTLALLDYRCSRRPSATTACKPLQCQTASSLRPSGNKAIIQAEVNEVFSRAKCKDKAFEDAKISIFYLRYESCLAVPRRGKSGGSCGSETREQKPIRTKTMPLVARCVTATNRTAVVPESGCIESIST